MLVHHLRNPFGILSIMLCLFLQTAKADQCMSLNLLFSSHQRPDWHSPNAIIEDHVSTNGSQTLSIGKKLLRLRKAETITDFSYHFLFSELRTRGLKHYEIRSYILKVYEILEALDVKGWDIPTKLQDSIEQLTQMRLEAYRREIAILNRAAGLARKYPKLDFDMTITLARAEREAREQEEVSHSVVIAPYSLN